MLDISYIDQLTNDILNGTRNLPQFTQSEHAGVCSAGPLLVGALAVCDIARQSLGASSDAQPSQIVPNWQIDEVQEQLVRQWAESKGVWVSDAEKYLTANYGAIVAQGAESKVYARTGDPCVVKLRTSIYATLQRALEAIALHNYLFPETIMRIVGFARDADGLFRVILTQPYIACERLATPTEIDVLVARKGFHRSGDTSGVNYLSDRLLLEDMHPANVFVEPMTHLPICIDCIVKFIP